MCECLRKTSGDGDLTPAELMFLFCLSVKVKLRSKTP